MDWQAVIENPLLQNLPFNIKLKKYWMTFDFSA